MVQHAQIDKCYTAHKKEKGQSHMTFSIDAEKHLTKFNISS
jgi:hypothetical protein